MKLIKHLIIYCCISLTLTGAISKSEASSILDDTRDWSYRNKKSLIAAGTLVTIGVGVAAYYLIPKTPDHYDPLDPYADSPLRVRMFLSDQPLCVNPSISHTSQAIGLLEYDTRLYVSGILDKLANSEKVVFECVRKYLCQYCGWLTTTCNLGCTKSWNHLNQTIMECIQKSDL